MTRASAYLPASFLALFAAWCGTLPGASSSVGWALGLLALASLFWRSGTVASLSWARDPWVALPLLALVPLVVARHQASAAVPGRLVALLLLLALAFVLPSAVAREWRSEGATQRGIAAIAAVLLGVGVWGLVAAFLDGSRPAMPLGHRNLLATWVVIVAPLVALGLRVSGWRRWLSGAALAVGLAVLLAGRSLGGAAALGAQLGLACVFIRIRRVRVALGALALGAFALQGPRLLVLLAGGDSSWAARRVYWRAGWQGFLARPWLGWGPGEVPTTLGRFLEPVPGINPPSEVVGQLHSVPLELLYELGALGFGAVLCGLGAFWWQRFRGWPRAVNPPLLAAGLVSLAGGAVAALNDSWSGALALPVAMAVAAGAALAGQGRIRAADLAPAEGPVERWLTRLLIGLVVVVATGSGWLGQRHYRRALAAATPEASCRELSEALRFEPGHALYLARRGACGEGNAGLARRAAELAPGIAVFQTSAGLAAARAGEPFEAWLRRGLAADPLGAAAPYFLMALRPEAPDAARCGARALLSEPRLFAATFFEEHPELVAPIRGEILRWPGLDAGWKQALAEALAPPISTSGPTGTFGLGFDDPQGGLSLYAFHRRAWPWEWFALPVRVARFEGLQLPSAAELPTSSPTAFPKDTCGY